ncbi:hypothetical protein [Streptomyces canus]|uniref:hypothetical protein n=1 Tax=Streptomyces canus TaxID=58343 RepID=UPI001319EF58|nr:hypothetical protein [Streptomyces canus]
MTHATRPTTRTGLEIKTILQKIQLVTINNILAKGPHKTGEPTRQETGQAREINILAVKPLRPAPGRTELHQRQLHRNFLKNLIDRLGQRRRDMQSLQQTIQRQKEHKTRTQLRQKNLTRRQTTREI